MGKAWLVGVLGACACAWGCSSTDLGPGPSGGGAGSPGISASAGASGAGIDVGNAGDVPPKCTEYCAAEKAVCSRDPGCELRCASSYHARPNRTKVADAYFSCAAANVVSCDPPGSFSFGSCAAEYAADEHCG